MLEELPKQARIQIFDQDGTRQAMIGVSPESALSAMDDVHHPECELYTEDEASKTLLLEMLSQRNRDLASRMSVSIYGAASVGYQLGQMVANKRFHGRRVGVFLDGDCEAAAGCCLMPGNEPPEVVVFEGLAAISWGDLFVRLLRDTSYIADACDTAMTLVDHHDGIGEAAKKLTIASAPWWHAMCAEWVKRCMKEADYDRAERYVEDRLAEAI